MRPVLAVGDTTPKFFRRAITHPPGVRRRAVPSLWCLGPASGPARNTATAEASLPDSDTDTFTAVGVKPISRV